MGAVFKQNSNNMLMIQYPLSTVSSVGNGQGAIRNLKPVIEVKNEVLEKIS